MTKWEVECDIRAMIREEALKEITRAVTFANRGLISFNEMIEIIEDTNDAKQKAEEKLRNMVWEQEET